MQGSALPPHSKRMRVGLEELWSFCVEFAGFSCLCRVPSRLSQCLLANRAGRHLSGLHQHQRGHLPSGGAVEQRQATER